MTDSANISNQNNPGGIQDNFQANGGGNGNTGSMKKEHEPEPSISADFSELKLPAEQNIESEPKVSENSAGVSHQANSIPAIQQSSQSQNTSNQTPQSSHVQHILTKQQAQQKIKGPLIFKNSGDPMLWLAYLLLRHYQLLEKEETGSKK